MFDDESGRIRGRSDISFDLYKGKLSKEQAKVSPKSHFVDPFAISNSIGYKDHRYSPSFDLLNAIPGRLAVVAAIIQTRCNQVAAFSVPFRHSKSVGFQIKMKDVTKHPSPSQKKYMEELEEYIYRCGNPRPNKFFPKKRDSFEDFLKKIVRQTLILDQVCVEIVPDRVGRPYEFLAVDAATIRMAAPNLLNPNEHDKVTKTKDYTGQDFNKFQNEFDPDAPAYVQLLDGKVVNTYTEDELVFAIRNPRADLRVQGYGYSELEQIINTITAHLNAEDYNRRAFTQGAQLQGILNFKGDAMAPEMLEAFKREWRDTLEGVQNCLDGSTKIYTLENGLVTLEELVSGNTEVPATIWTGLKWENGLAFRTTEPKKLWSLTTNCGTTVKSSPDHKFLVVRDGNVGPEWISRENLSTGDVLLSNKKSPESGVGTPFIDGDDTSADFWEYLGWAIGDGSFTYKGDSENDTSGKVSTFYNETTERDIWDQHQLLLSNYFENVVSQEYIRSQDQKDRITAKYGFKHVADSMLRNEIFSSELYTWLKSNGFCANKWKSISPKLHIESSVNKCAFLRGLFSADGNNQTRRNPKLTCADDTLRAEVRELLRSVGIRCNKSEGLVKKISKVGNTEYVAESKGRYLTIRDKDEFFSKIGFIQKHKYPVCCKNPNECGKQDSLPLDVYQPLLRSLRDSVGYSNAPSAVKAGMACCLIAKHKKNGIPNKKKADGCSVHKLIKFYEACGEVAPEWATSYNIEIVDDLNESEELVQMYDVSIFDNTHAFIANGIVTHNSFRTPILQAEQGIEWVSLKSSNREMEYGQWLEYLLKLVTSVYLIDPAELNFDLHGGVQNTPLFESTQEWKLKASRDKGLRPLLKFIAKILNDHIVTKIDDNYVLTFEGLDELTEKDKHDLRKEQVATYRTLNEIRAEQDLPSLPYGDMPMNPTYIQGMQATIQQQQQEQQSQQSAGGSGQQTPDGNNAQQNPTSTGSNTEQQERPFVPSYSM